MKMLYLINVLSFLALGLAAFAIFLRVRKEALAGSMPQAGKERNGSRARQTSGSSRQAKGKR